MKNPGYYNAAFGLILALFALFLLSVSASVELAIILFTIDVLIFLIVLLAFYSVKLFHKSLDFYRKYYGSKTNG